MNRNNSFFKAAMASIAVFLLMVVFMETDVLSISTGANGPVRVAINGPRVVGSTPGKPFLFLIPATGRGPLEYSAANLPPGLSLDTDTGIIEGTLAADGVYVVKLKVIGPDGEARRNLNIVGGKNKLARTPPMGWNSWNVWGTSVDDARVRAAADAMISSGLAARGYMYVNIDDGWEAGRDADGEIVPNEKFPDMKALADYVHSKGLKIGIYSSPGPKTCAGYEGSHGHEKRDAETYAKWGIDYLKYDWCSYGRVKDGWRLKDYKKPYIMMGRYLRESDRDIVFSLCQYGMRDVWEWGESVGGNLWRTTFDVFDRWWMLSWMAFRQDGLEKYSGPGHWNDPDMLVVGKVGWGPEQHATRLTRDEQKSHITLWAMLAAPLLIGCDMSDMDRFTLEVLTNAEVLEVDQDPLGKQGRRVAKKGRCEVWARPLWDGTYAVALFNRGVFNRNITVKWADLGLSGTQRVRDLWRHEDLGGFDDSYTAIIPSHGAVLLKVGTPRKSDFDLLEK